MRINLNFTIEWTILQSTGTLNSDCTEFFSKFFSALVNP